MLLKLNLFLFVQIVDFLILAINLFATDSFQHNDYIANPDRKHESLGITIFAIYRNFLYHNNKYEVRIVACYCFHSSVSINRFPIGFCSSMPSVGV